MESFAPPAPPTERERRTMRNRAGSAIVALGLLLAKFKGVLLLIPKLKILTTSGTMLVSIVAYSFIFGWPFAVGLVLLILVHEMGHYIQFRREGVKPSAPVFVPFIGAAVVARNFDKGPVASARVSLAGPLIGGLGALATVGLYAATDNELYKALAFTGFFLNLVNLVPFGPLDGGQALRPIASPAVWLFLFAVFVAIAFVAPGPIVIIVAALLGYEAYKHWRDRHSLEESARSAIPVSSRTAIVVAYLVIAGLLAIGMHETHLARSFSDV